MLFPEVDYAQPDDINWQRINMRKVAHLVGVEMIHNLYDRYWPQINSIRFHHTVTNYKDGIVESFAPKREWDYLKKWVSQKFVNEDPILIREIEKILKPDYALTNEICQIVDNTNLSEIDNRKLALLLIDIMDFPLGEIYRLNVVQIEYGLNFALDQILTDFEPDKAERNQLLTKLISPSTLTVAQEEEIAFDALLVKARQTGNSDKLSDTEISNILSEHYIIYAGKHCAYGEVPPAIDEYIAKFRAQVNDKVLTTSAEAELNLAKQHKQSQDMLEILDDQRLTRLCNLMSRIGTFRDQNKGKVGETVPRRLRILDEIANRKNVPRDDINFYLVGELVELLDEDKRLDSQTLATRRQGITLVRSDYMSSSYTPVISSQTEDENQVISGICASDGSLEGTVRIIKTKDDIVKMTPGDIMVAIGTDFDLLEIMHLAGGIITEEGGLLSHASVVSRELKKPCVIGVTNATKLLQDGQRIYLDATKGTIKKL